jgi:hypothetical protein
MIDNRKAYWALVILGAVAAIVGIFMRKSLDPSLHDKATYVGWTGIGMLLVARIFFKPRPQPKEISDLFPPKKQK